MERPRGYDTRKVGISEILSVLIKSQGKSIHAAPVEEKDKIFKQIGADTFPAADVWKTWDDNRRKQLLDEAVDHLVAFVSKTELESIIAGIHGGRCSKNNSVARFQALEMYVLVALVLCYYPVDQ